MNDFDNHGRVTHQDAHQNFVLSDRFLDVLLALLLPVVHRKVACEAADVVEKIHHHFLALGGKVYLRVELNAVNVEFLVGNPGHNRPGGGNCLEVVGQPVQAVAVGQQDFLLLFQTSEIINKQQDCEKMKRNSSRQSDFSFVSSSTQFWRQGRSIHRYLP